MYNIKSLLKEKIPITLAYTFFKLVMAKGTLIFLVLVCLVFCTFSQMVKSLEVEKQNHLYDKSECSTGEDCVAYCRDHFHYESCGCDVSKHCCCIAQPPPNAYL